MKKKLKDEIAKLRDMTFAEKRWYLWEYYKFYFIGTVLVAIMAGSFIHSVLNPQPESYVYIAWYGIPVYPRQMDDFAEGLSVIVDDPETQEVTIYDYSMTQDPQMNQAVQTRFTAMLQMGEIDVFITTLEDVEIFADGDYIRTLDEVAEILQETNPGLFAAFEERLTFDNFAVSLENSPYAEQYEIDTADLYLCVIVNTRRFYQIAELLEVLLYGA